MLKHIVMWKVNADADKEKIKQAIKENLLALYGKVESLKEIEVVTDVEETSTHELMLVTAFDDAKGLALYANDLRHVEVVETYIKPYTYDRVAIDYIF